MAVVRFLVLSALSVSIFAQAILAQAYRGFVLGRPWRSVRLPRRFASQDSPASAEPIAFDRPLKAMSLEAVRARLHSARVSLERRKGGDAEVYAQLSAVEKGAVGGLLRPIVAHLDDELRSVLVELIDQMPWASGDSEDLTKLVLAGAKSTVKVKKDRKERRQMQDFRNFVDSINLKDWKLLLEDKIGPQAKRDLIMRILVRLGCRCASEPTKKLAISFWVHLTGTTSLDSEAKKRLRDSFGKDLYKMGAKEGAPEVYWGMLPMPAEMEEEHPECFSKLFGGAPAVKCQIDQMALMEEDAGMKCRRDGTVELARRLRPDSSPMLDLGASAPTGQMEKLGMMMLKGMEHMAASQAKVLEIVLGGSGSGSGSRSLSQLQPQGVLQGSSPLTEAPFTLRRSVTFGRTNSMTTADDYSLGDQQSAAWQTGPPPPGAIVPAPPAAAKGPTLTAADRKRRHEAATQCVKKAREEELSTSTAPSNATGAPKAPVGPHRAPVSSVIDTLLDEREAQKAAEAKVVKTAAKAAAQAAVKAASNAAAKTPTKQTQHELQVTPSKAPVLKEQTKPESQKTPTKAPAKKSGPQILFTTLTEEASPAKCARPHFHLEKSRGQVLCRSGFKGVGQSVALKYGAGEFYSNVAEALAAAEEWVQGL